MAKAKKKSAPRKKKPGPRKKPAPKTTTSAKPETDPVLAAELLAKVRAFCATLPGVTEKLSHGAPTFFIKAGTFANFCDNHHHDGKISVWCAAPDGAQAMLVESEPEHYFVPSYVGGMGWVGMRLDRGIAWSQVEATLEAAHTHRSTKKRR
jgi:hypothetical protein